MMLITNSNDRGLLPLTICLICMMLMWLEAVGFVPGLRDLRPNGSARLGCAGRRDRNLQQWRVRAGRPAEARSWQTAGDAMNWPPTWPRLPGPLDVSLRKCCARCGTPSSTSWRGVRRPTAAPASRARLRPRSMEMRAKPWRGSWAQGWSPNLAGFFSQQEECDRARRFAGVRHESG